MAVAEITKTEEAKKKLEKRGDDGDKSAPGKPNFVQEAVTFVPRKWNDLRTFLIEVRAELKKVTWPSRNEVQVTTVIIIATTVFFGFYLWGIDAFYTSLLARFMGGAR
jgi:preprotein translocase subunit SecE